jgi:MFS superfamily sulfate permease-like transporter
LVVALRSSLPFTIAAPDTSTSAVSAALAAALAGRLIATGAGANLLEPTLIVMAIGSALAGILLCGLGVAHAGRLIRFVPLSGDWRISWRDRLADSRRRHQGDDRRAALLLRS